MNLIDMIGWKKIDFYKKIFFLQYSNGGTRSDWEGATEGDSKNEVMRIISDHPSVHRSMVGNQGDANKIRKIKEKIDEARYNILFAKNENVIRTGL